MSAAPAGGGAVGQAAGNLVRGMLVGSVEVVPGVSGGTVALVLGIYHRLIEAIRTGARALGRLLRGDLRGCGERLREVEWLLIVPLLIGMLLAVVLLASPIERALSSYPVQMAGLFMGLVAGSALVAVRLVPSWRGWQLGLLAAAAVVFFLLLGLVPAANDRPGAVPDAPLWAFFGAGAVAICAMVLPGISGSFMLVAMGMYAVVLTALNERDLIALAVFALGCVIGLAVFSQVLHWALSEHFEPVMAVLIGLMLGSLRVLWPWPAGVESTELGLPSGPVAATLGLAVLGLVVVLVIDEAGKRLGHHTTAEETAELQAT